MKKFMKIFLVLFILLGFISTNSNVAVADDEVGSISVNILAEDLFDDTAPPLPLPGMEFKVYQIWKLVNNQIVFNDAFKNVAEINGEMTSNEIQKTAEKFLEVSYNAPVFATLETDENGNMKLDVPKGAYLFVQTYTLQYMEEDFNTNPFLVTVPFRNPQNDELLMNVDATPKVAIFRSLPAEKKVNDEIEYDVEDFDEEFTYSITADIPLARAKFEIVDNMEPVLLFPKNKNIEDFVSVRIGDDELTAEELRKQITLGDHSIKFTATEKQLQEKQGQEVELTFTALLDKNADLSPYIEGVPNDFELNIDDKVELYSEPVKVTPPPKRPPRIPNTAAWLLNEAREHPQVFYPVLLLILLLLFIIIKAIVDRRKKHSY